MNPNTVPNKLNTAIWISSFSILTIFLFNPLDIYISNLGNLHFYTNTLIIIVYSLALSLLLITLSTIFLMLFRTEIFKKLITVFFLLSCMIWIYSTVLVWDYGLFDGISPEWEKLSYRGLIDLGVYFLFIFVYFAKRNFIYSIAKKASIMFIIIQLISIIIINTAPAKLSLKNYIVDPNQKFDFSKEKNVIILIVDSFQTDFFQEIITTDPSFKEIFKGFTYFKNTTGGFINTTFSTVLILTEKFYDNSITKNEFTKNSLLSDSSLPKILKKNGFYTDLHPKGLFYWDEEIASNYVKIDPSKINPVITKVNSKLLFNEDILFDFVQLLDVSFYRMSPHFIKKRYYTDSYCFLKRFITLDNINRFLHPGSQQKIPDKQDKPFLSSNTIKDSTAKFIQSMHENISTQKQQPVFKHYHLKGLHRPLYLDENLKYHDKAFPENRKSYIRSAKGSLKLIEKFLFILKEKNIYDNSMILILADHGTNKIDPNLEYSGYCKNASNNIYPCTISSALPLLLIKRFNEKGALKTSEAAISLKNIAPTILDELNIEKAKESANSAFKIDPAANIERRFFTYKVDPNEQNLDYLGEITEHTITGFSWLESSWKLKKK